MHARLSALLVIVVPAAGILLAPALLRPAARVAPTTSEPSSLAKLVRRSKVYWLATRLFVDIKLAQRKDRSLRRRLGLGEDDEHEKLEAMWAAVHERNSAMLYRNIIRLSGFWVKVGQYLSSRADVMPPQYTRTLAALQDAVPQKPFDEVVQTLQEELLPEKLGLFHSIDTEPLSTASLAQVHRATLVDGRQVVIKAQHRGVASLMRQDMANLESILGVVARFDRDADFGPVVREWTAEVLKELDFRTEATNMAEVRSLIERRRIRALVPAAVPELVTQRVLVMEFCAGFPIRDTAQLDAFGVDREVLLQRVCAAWAAQMHEAGVFNADPHPGNILVSTASDDDASVPVLLDFGLTKRFTRAQTVAFARLVHAAEENDVDGLLQSFDEMGLRLNRYDPFEDMATMRRSLSDTVPASEAKAASKQRTAERKEQQAAQREEDERREEEQEQEQEQEEGGGGGGAKGGGGRRRNPVDAWPAELVFFTRVSAMLRGLCSSLEVRHPYLATMAASARVTLRETVPRAEHAAAAVFPTPRGLEDSPLQARLEGVAATLVARGEAVGMQVVVRQHGAVLADVAAGTLGVADPRPVTPSSLFNVFSVSKAVLAAGVHLLLQESDGAVGIDDAVAAHWPAFGAAGKGGVTVRQLLAHQAGLADALPPAATLDALCTWDDMTAHVAGAAAAHAPGAETRYHYLTFAWLCGGLIEAVTGAPYDDFLRARLLEPALARLGLADQLYMGGLPASVGAERLAVLSIDRRSSSAGGEGAEGAEGEREARRAEATQAAATRQGVPLTAAVQPGGGGGGAPSAAAAPAEVRPDADDSPSRARLAKYRGREQMLNPSVFNMRKVRAAKLPSANGHASAAALAALLEATGAAAARAEGGAPTADAPGLLSAARVDEMRAEQRSAAVGWERAGDEGGGGAPPLLDNAGAAFGLGVQVHEFTLADGSSCRSIGHSGLGGSEALTLPEAGLSFAFTTNTLSMNSAAKAAVVRAICDELGIVAPRSLLSVP